MMQGERARRNGENPNGFVAISVSSTSSSFSPAAGVNYIEHRVSKMDTLAGVAIKYGVEVADIKRMNGLVTDLQMFAHKSLQIPLPGRHPPSPVLANVGNGEQTPRHRYSDVVSPLQSLKLKPPPERKVSPAMTSLQGYYGISSSRKGLQSEGTEMIVYKTGRALFLEDESISRVSPVSDPLLNHHKTKSLVNDSTPMNGNLMDDATITDVGETSETERSNSEKSVRRRQKADTDSFLRMALLEDSGGGISGKTGRGLIPRPKSGSRTDNEISRSNTSTAGDSSMANGFLAVRKSSSTSNLQDSENGASVWPPWNLKADVIARPIFDGLPNPMNVWKNKAAVD